MKGMLFTFDLYLPFTLPEQPAKRFDSCVERCSESSCTICTLRFLHSVRLAPGTSRDGFSESVQTNSSTNQRVNNPYTVLLKHASVSI